MIPTTNVFKFYVQKHAIHPLGPCGIWDTPSAALRANASLKVAFAAFSRIWGAARMCDNPEHLFYHIDGYYAANGATLLDAPFLVKESIIEVSRSTLGEPSRHCEDPVKRHRLGGKHEFEGGAVLCLPRQTSHKRSFWNMLDNDNWELRESSNNNMGAHIRTAVAALLLVRILRA
ncbi:uncharacterized protein TRAVEDRAFT_24778 [Trametes versicolor FP-101664 SS1]|uniref:Uncharacterized protein n=1 Tax=Trametes versicolor (strain FP-101664) TaxID=717944 RepID=R7S7T2_TRAVS|nr:uncharacterized protein TRAVEDRAFT_24778 [Trametes versicolor FP-101664 SS1]EIW52103.1 hypothetical protein TRAVEDRAFT_24778 [Trametes versicolor FP-101664 SS1]